MSDQAVADRKLSIDEASAVAGVTRRTIYNWLYAGKLTYVKTAGGAYRIFESSLFRSGDDGPKAA